MQIHVVQRGESLWRIAQHYGSDMNQIAYVNELDNPDVLVVGEALVIPDPNREYVVQAGDNLWSIAQMYGVTVQELAEVNNITNPSLIYIGQMLIIPYFAHVVQPGESLWTIAQVYGVTVNQLVQANNIANPGLIQIGQTLGIPAADRPVTEINAFTTQLNEQGSQEVLALGRNFTYLSPFSYHMNADGTITNLQDELVLEAANATNSAPLLVLTNFSNGTFDSDMAATILRDPDLQETLISNLIHEMNTKGYIGINFDLEYVYPADRENYNDFLRRTVARMHPQGLIVSTAVAPKISADQQGLLYEAHDYRAHGEIVDFVFIMTYEWGWAGGRPGAIAPISNVQQVLDYAVTEIPRSKIAMGIPLYGRDWEIPWVEGTTARTISPKAAVQLAAGYGAVIAYDETAQSPFFRYVDENGQAHEVWFEDARSMQAKYDTLKNYGLRGAGYWVLGNPFPQNWAVLQNNFGVRKF
ncbi:LysM peptidoglycan-binding domain-containing protein [Virgibacillus sp. NKC19-3]|uniref:LysM peptidoglycan-binding domain-containing protein n=1 Tax=Virgibacillus saliphilus TaxID=2831674 RepID=UPI001C9AFD57|nr:LysM peptidoglycan-binding domain-containing protein [Virgibacillus sp. NKC19-3]MBY7142117.1 LysM peptidoglycan-binding domain-containing protein [Virgibacillus sp. NKC19-3]